MSKNRRAILALGLLGMPFSAFAVKRGRYCHPLFGELTFETLDQEWMRGGKIRFISGFDRSKIQPLFLPQIVGIPRSTKGETNDGKIDFHIDAHAQLLNAFSEIEQQGLLRKMISFGGAHFQPRLGKPIDATGQPILSRRPSNHSFGTAFDVNAIDNRHGATARPFVEIFEANGFERGGKLFNDPMHFQVKTFIGAPPGSGPTCAAPAPT